MVKKDIIKATIRHIIVAFIYVLIVVLLINIFFIDKISLAISLINSISIAENKEVYQEVKIDLESKKLVNYPLYGSKYGNIEIPSISVNLPLYFGDTLDILKKGIGQASGSYFPGEGGSILCAGHSYRGYIRSLPQVNIGDVIKVNTEYGKFEYQIYETRIIQETDLEAVGIQNEEEIFMLYTCYPVDQIGHPTKRFVVYAKLLGQGE